MAKVENTKVNFKYLPGSDGSIIVILNKDVGIELISALFTPDLFFVELTSMEGMTQAVIYGKNGTRLDLDSNYDIPTLTLDELFRKFTEHHDLLESHAQALHTDFIHCFVNTSEGEGSTSEKLILPTDSESLSMLFYNHSS